MKVRLCVLLTLLSLLTGISVSAQSEPVYWIAYTASSHRDPNAPGCTYGLCIVPSDGSTRAQSLSEDAADFSPVAWSPDGQWIAYLNVQGDLEKISMRDRKPILIASQQQLIELFKTIRLAVADATMPIAKLRWSPDGQELFFLLNKGSEAPGLYSLGIEGRTIREIVPASALFSVFDFSFSPDGEWIGYLHGTLAYASAMQGNLYRVRIDGSGQQLLSDTSVEVVSFAWSPRGERLYYNTVEADNRSLIYSIAPNGNDRQLLLSSYPYSFASALTATQHAVFFIPPAPMNMAQYEKVYRLDLAHGDVRALPEAGLLGDGFELMLAAPTGESIAAIGTDVAGLGVYGAGLFILNPDGQIRLLAGYPILEMGNVAWSPVPIND